MTPLIIDHLPGRLLRHAGHDYLFCSGTGYLGMAHSPAFAALVTEGFTRYGTNYSSSRTSNIRLQVYEQAEHYLAYLTGAAGAVTVSSGYLAGQMAVKALARAGQFVYAPGTHPAAWLAEALAFSQAAPVTHQQWVDMLLNHLAETPPVPMVIVSNSLDPLQAKPQAFGWLAQLPSDRPITVLVDDSHGFGVTGPGGAGIFPELAAPPTVRVVVVASLGKACGIPGGVVLSSDAEFVRELRGSAFFAASSPVVPAYLHAFLRADALYTQARQQLAANVAQFVAQIPPDSPLRWLPGFPVFYSPDNALTDFLLQRDIWISSFPYPSPSDPPITRIVLSALHTSKDIERLALAVQEFRQQEQ